MKHTQPPEPMSLAFAEAVTAGRRGEVPIGCIITDQSGNVMAKAGKRKLELKDPNGPAEMVSIREEAAKLGTQKLTGFEYHGEL